MQCGSKYCYEDNGYTPLHYAARKNNFETIKALINNKANIDVEDNEGVTPLGHACGWRSDGYRYPRMNVIRLLVQQGADLYASIPCNPPTTPQRVFFATQHILLNADDIKKQKQISLS